MSKVMHYLDVDSARFKELAHAPDWTVYNYFRSVHGIPDKEKELPGSLQHNRYRITKQPAAVIVHLFNDSAEVASFGIRPREASQAVASIGSTSS